MSRIKQIFLKSKYIIIYGVSMALMVFILKWLQWKYLIADNSLDLYTGLIAIFFTILGVWVATQLARSKVRTVVVEKEIYRNRPEDDEIDEAELKKLNLTTREYEVLQLIAQGNTNAEIAERLFLSLSTVKTHVSNLFVKMEVKNRTQAIEKANRLKLTA
ncbi:response regulator transcription factor [Fulvivirga ulvae]|uniref:response regulator transcription factor n=1 Tax=Fulvivirga ulvae TaxID=2904245 RepID=UPI001F244685|nr:response regulator transcription factor [Fulvivirga ulvae]UII34623.1 response regulator transcription factor [Fulvivirga ulvae]